MKRRRQTGHVVIYIDNLKIAGDIYTESEYTRGRISDSLNRKDKKFLPVTGAKIYDYDTGDLLDEKEFMFVNREHILYVKPEEEKDNE